MDNNIAVFKQRMGWKSLENADNKSDTVSQKIKKKPTTLWLKCMLEIKRKKWFGLKI